MAKKTVSAKEILSDIRAGIDDGELCNKYELSNGQLEKIFKKLVAAKAITQEELDNRGAEHLLGVDISWKCPSCGQSQQEEFAECPRCGVLVKKFLEKQERERAKKQEKPKMETGGFRREGEPVAVETKGETEPVVESPKLVKGTWYKTPTLSKSAQAIVTLIRGGSSATRIGLLALLSATLCFALATISAHFFFLGLLICMPVILTMILMLHHKLQQQNIGEQSTTPSSFLGLDRHYRKRALDLAWSSGIGRAVEKAAASTGKGFQKAVASLLFIAAMCLLIGGFVYNIMGFIEVEEYRSSTHTTTDRSVQQDPDKMLPLPGVSRIEAGAAPSILPKTKEERWEEIVNRGERTVSQYCFGSLLLFLALFVSVEQKPSGLDNDNLKELAVQFIMEQAPIWLEQVKALTHNIALERAQSKAEAGFVLLSFPISSSTSLVVPPRLHISYIFSNGYVSVVSNIVWNIIATSYSLVEQDKPSLAISDANSWRTHEFHYRDVIEVSYVPSDKKPNGGTAPATRTKLSEPKEGEIVAEGYLELSLVNGTMKQYPATQNGVTDFMALARKKVREAKRSSE